jgi:predicted nucleic acid-binding protein
MGRLIRWVSLGGLNVAELSGSALELMAGWMRQYGDLPLDLADASLLWLAQERGLRRIATLDRRDFGLVRFPGGESLENLLDA